MGRQDKAMILKSEDLPVMSTKRPRGFGWLISEAPLGSVVLFVWNCLGQRKRCTDKGRG